MKGIDKTKLKIKERLDELKKLEDGWYDENSKAPLESNLELVKYYIEYYYPENLDVPIINPLPINGDLLIEWEDYIFNPMICIEFYENQFRVSLTTMSNFDKISDHMYDVFNEFDWKDFFRNEFEPLRENHINLLNNLAEFCHDVQWSSWMKYVFSKGYEDKDGNFVIMKNDYNRWKRQTETSYENLSEKEKESDIIEANKILNLLISLDSM